jgi:hypothetical protein
MKGTLKTIRDWEETYLASRFGAIPARCPKCGATRIVRIFWRQQARGGPIGSSIEHGCSILGGDRPPPDAPIWACLDCQPAWMIVHELSLQFEVLQLEQENVLTQGDFDRAASYRSPKDAIRRQQQQVIEALVRSTQEPA